MAKKSTIEMLGEMCREGAVLWAVFATMDAVLKRETVGVGWHVTTLVISLSLGMAGMYLERRRTS